MARDFEDVHDLDDLSDRELRDLVRDRLAANNALDIDDLTVVDLDRRRTDGVGQHDARAADDQLRAARFRNDPAPAFPTNVPLSITSFPRDSTVSAAPVT